MHAPLSPIVHRLQDSPWVQTRLLPGARLVYLVRDPIVRALSHYHHHRAEGSERRDLAAALCDPASQYVARVRYHERVWLLFKIWPVLLVFFLVIGGIYFGWFTPT